jgi:hypothetical protein
MRATHEPEAALSKQEELPKPRLWWLAAFHVTVIAAVVGLARLTTGFATAPLLEDELRDLTRSPLPGAVHQPAWSGRGWLVAVVAMVSALLLMLPIAWAYVATRDSRKVDRSVVTTITLLPIAVAAILVIVQDSLAVAFSLAGIAGLVRFRNALDDTKDAMYVFVAIAVGLGAGVGALEASAALSGLFNLVVIALWKWNRSQPVIADIALGEQSVPRGKTILDTLLPTKEAGPHPAPVAEWYEATEAKPLVDTPRNDGDGASPKREGILRVRAADNVETRRTIKDVVEARAKRWVLESEEPGPDGLPALTYRVRLKKRREWSELLEALQTRLGPQLAAPEAEQQDARAVNRGHG